MSDLVYALAEVAQPGTFGAAEEGGPGVTLAELRPDTALQVGAWPDTKETVEAVLASSLKLTIPARPGLAAAGADGTLMVIAPGRYLLISNSAGITERLAEEINAERGVITDLSHARAGVRLSGRNAVDVLNKGFAIDLDIRKFPVHSVAQTTFHHVGLTLHRVAEESFELFVFRGFAVSFWEALTDAALEYGYQVVAEG